MNEAKCRGAWGESREEVGRTKAEGGSRLLPGKELAGAPRTRGHTQKSRAQD